MVMLEALVNVTPICTYSSVFFQVGMNIFALYNELLLTVCPSSCPCLAPMDPENKTHAGVKVFRPVTDFRL